MHHAHLRSSWAYTPFSASSGRSTPLVPSRSSAFRPTCSTSFSWTRSHLIVYHAYYPVLRVRAWSQDTVDPDVYDPQFDDNQTDWPVLVYLGYTLRFHIGTAAFGALVLTFVTTLQVGGACRIATQHACTCDVCHPCLSWRRGRCSPR